MHHYLKAMLWVGALAVPAAHAQKPDGTSPAATDAAVSVPAATYNSAFTGYQPYREQKPAPWREVNDAVQKAGGHSRILGGSGGTPPATAQHHPEHKK
jgi:hypothetical protein